MSLRIAILLSGKHGGGSNMAAIAEACADGRIDGSIVRVVGNFAESPALARAETLGLPVAVVPSPARADGPAAEDAYARRLCATLADAAPDLVCLAGYLRRIPPAVVSAYKGRMMNIHPALLPAFGGQGMYGRRVHEAVLASGVKRSGCTVHFVDEDYDTGPIILQSVVPVQDDDTPETLAARVLTVEHQTYPRAVGLFAEGQMHSVGRRVLG